MGGRLRNLVISGSGLVAILGIGGGCETPGAGVPQGRVGWYNEKRTGQSDEEFKRELAFLNTTIPQYGNAARASMAKYNSNNSQAMADGNLSAEEINNLKEDLKNCIMTSQRYRDVLFAFEGIVTSHQRNEYHIRHILPVEENIDLWNGEYLKLSGR